MHECIRPFQFVKEDENDKFFQEEISITSRQNMLVLLKPQKSIGKDVLGR